MSRVFPMLLTAAAMLLLVFVNSAAAQARGEAQLVAYAKRNAGKFPSEVQAVEPVNIRVAFSYSWGGAEYDDEQQAAKLYAGDVRIPLVFYRCKSKGSYTGVSGLGAKVRVVKQDCERLEIDARISLERRKCDADEEPKIADANNTELPCEKGYTSTFLVKMTPSQFRDLHADSGWFDLEFWPGQDVKNQPVATLETYHVTAKVSSPYETDEKVWNVRGVIKKARLLARDGKTVLLNLKP